MFFWPFNFSHPLLQVQAELKAGESVTLRQPKPGFFSRLFGSSSSEKSATTLTPEEIQVQARACFLYLLAFVSHK